MIELSIPDRLAAAKAGDRQAFSDLAEPYRAELLAHCYRLLGAADDAEDMVQETFLRAWNRLESFSGGPYFRAWLYKIATNVCLDALDKRPRRMLAPAHFPPADPRAPFAPAIHEPIWLEPFPDELLPHSGPGPEARYSMRESISLAFLTALQLLPPRQRAVLILVDVLDWRASEVAALLDMTLSAAHSALHRARATMRGSYNAARITPAGDEQVHSVLSRYVEAWEAGDVDALVALLTDTVIFAMPPRPSWFLGRDAVRAHVEIMLPGGATGRWRLIPTRSNGQDGLACYRYNPGDGRFQAHALQVFRLAEGQIAEIQMFVLPRLMARFGLPLELDEKPA